MNFSKKAICILLTAALLLAAPCTVFAEEGGEIPLLSEAQGDAASTLASEGEPEETTAPEAPIEGEEAPAQEAPEEHTEAEEAPVEAETGAENETSPGQQEAVALAAAAPEGPQDWQTLDNGLVLAPAEDVSMYPIVRYSGAMNSLYRNPDPNLPMEEWDVAFSNSVYKNVDNLLSVAKDAFLAYCRFDYKRVSQIISDFIWECFQYARMDDNGDPYYPEITMNPWLLYGWRDDKGVYNFNTDWREDPVESAKKLRTYIEGLCGTHNCDKVNLIGVSGNGNTVLAYLNEYQDDLKLASVFFNYSLHGGSSTYGDLAVMKAAINPHALGNMSPNKMEDKFVSPDPYEILLRSLYEIGLFDYAAKLFKFNYDRVKQDIYDNAAIPLLFTNPHLWSYVPMAQYEQAKKLLLKEDPKYDNLVKKIDYYHYEIMGRQNEILQETARKIKVAVRAGYNRPLYAYTAGADVHSDDKVDTALASFGATCAPLNQTFSICYEQKVPSNYNYISPDRMIDASTCAIPALTWFGKNQPHLEAGTRYYGDWYDWFLSTDGNYTVHGNEEYPQFMNYLGGAVYVPLTEERSQAEDVLAAMGLWVLKAWRWVLMAPLFWV